jgi:hypothetical protein
VCRAALPRPARTRSSATPEERGAPEAEEEAGRDPADDQALAEAASRATIRPLGALAKLDKAPASKVGDSRFESWVPRLPPA